jgi:hypothetical protein
MLALNTLFVAMLATSIGKVSGQDELVRAAGAEALKANFYSVHSRLVGKVWPDGAVSYNGEGKFFIEQQRYGGDLIQAGVELGDERAIKEGIKIIDWGFRKQGPDGGFPGTGDPFHSTSLFVEAAARSIIFLKTERGASFGREVKQWTGQLDAAARWLTRDDVESVGRRNNLPYAHRRWLLAAALGESAAVTGDQSLFSKASEYAEDGLKLQQPSGENPEKGGKDLSYECLGLTYAARYCYVCPERGLRGKVARMIGKGLDFVSEFVGSSGDVDTQGDTRTTVEVGHSGKKKTVDYKNIVQSFVYGADILGNQSYMATADRIASRWGS